MKRSYAIVVDIPESDDTKCFIAFPFKIEDTSNYPITDVISKALLRENMTPTWTNWAEPGIIIDTRIRSNIREASMVIAICTPSADNCTNPNVMYELGLADAIGKPTLIMTTNAEELPFDISNRNAFNYNPSDTEDKNHRDALIDRLCLSISHLKRVTRSEGFILKDAPGIHVITATDRIFLEAPFWSYVKSVENISYNIQDEVAAITSNANKLSYLASRLLWPKGTEKNDTLNDIFTTWNDFKNSHEKRLNKCLDDTSLADAKNLLLELKTPSKDDNISTILQVDLENLTTKVKEHAEKYQKSSESIDSLIFNASKDPSGLYREIDAIVKSVESLGTYANNTTKHLDKVIYDSFWVS
ncbi:hypothetical protein [Endothiovibrio diazotrophicus]